MNRTVVLLLPLFVAQLAHAGTFIPAQGESYDTEDLHKISFVGDKVVAEWNDGSTKTYDLSSLQRIYFTDMTPTDVESQLSDQGLQFLLYPNPVVETLYLTGVPQDADVQILSMGGVVVQQLRANGNTLQTTVSGLAKGTYLVKVVDKVVKFVKQ